jgi:ABC-type uncharacterized transport system substrate-binding protein
MMDRRAFIAMVGGSIFAVACAVGAQQAGKLPRIGYLGPTSASGGARLLESFRQGLRELGYVEGQNIFVDYRWADGMPDRFPALAAELIQLRVDAIVTYNNAPVAALQHATRTVPIIAANMGDPVGSGFVTSLARPGGNITGFSGLAEDLVGKWVTLLREAVPTISRFIVLAVSQTPAHDRMRTEIQGAAKALKVTVQRQEVTGPDDIENAFAHLVTGRSQGLIVLPHAVTSTRRAQIVGLAAKHRLAGMYPDRQYVEAGGLMSYAANFSDLHRRTAAVVDKILKGAKPADLPVEQPTKFELIINLKTAKALGLTIPQSILVRADEIIQ